MTVGDKLRGTSPPTRHVLRRSHRPPRRLSPARHRPTAFTC